MVSTGRRHHLVVSTGVARVWGKRVVASDGVFGNGDLEHIDPRIGVPLEAALFFPFSRVLGVGVSVHGNINTEAPFFALTGNLLLGKIR